MTHIKHCKTRTHCKLIDFGIFICTKIALERNHIWNSKVFSRVFCLIGTRKEFYIFEKKNSEITCFNHKQHSQQKKKSAVKNIFKYLIRFRFSRTPTFGIFFMKNTTLNVVCLFRFDVIVLLCCFLVYNNGFR